MEHQELKALFPKRNTQFTIESFYQVEVDEFNDGHFLYLGVQEIDIKVNDRVRDMTESVDAKGIAVSVYSYSWGCYTKIILCKYKQKPWKNGYTIRGNLANENGGHDYSISEDVHEFIKWMDISKNI